jgi:hypothetical protein
MSKLIRIFAVLAVTAVAGLSGATTTAKAATLPPSLQTIATTNLSACIADARCSYYLRLALRACRAYPSCADALAQFLADNPDIAAILEAFEAPAAA